MGAEEITSSLRIDPLEVDELWIPKGANYTAIQTYSKIRVFL
jgi:hypothetical protein